MQVNTAWLVEAVQGAGGACPSPHLSHGLPPASCLSLPPPASSLRTILDTEQSFVESGGREAEKANHEQKAGKRACGQRGCTRRTG